MKCKILVLASLTALFSIFANPCIADADDSPVSYVLQSSAAAVPLGQSPGLRLLVINRSAVSLLHVLNPSAYEVTIEGPDGHRVWAFQGHVMIVGLRLQSGETAYLFGDSTSYRYPDTIYFDHAGAYHIRYCDRWTINGRQKKICSNNLEVHVGTPDADHDGG